MEETNLPVFWSGTIVGHLINAKVDNFDLYGKWVPEHSETTDQFLTRLDMGEQIDVYVGIKEPLIVGTIETIPSVYIEIKIRP